jgi:hypothetical protein
VTDEEEMDVTTVTSKPPLMLIDGSIIDVTVGVGVTPGEV